MGYICTVHWPKHPVEAYCVARPSLLAYASRFVGPEHAGDAVHDAVLYAVEHSLGGMSWRGRFLAYRKKLAVQNTKVRIGLPLSLHDAANLAESIEARVRLERASRVLTRGELDLLLAEYSGQHSDTRIRIRRAQKKARHAQYRSR